MAEWELAEEFLKSDMDRVDNPEYFMKEFDYTEILHFFSEISTSQQINQKRISLNLFFDRFLNLAEGAKTIYTQLKWIIVLHEVIQNLKENTPLYGLVFKALQVLIENFGHFEQKQGPYERYIAKILVKPYILYLCKLCLLNIPDEIAKEDEISAKEMETKDTCDVGEKSNIKSDNQGPQLEQIQFNLVDWYRKYNFISITLDIFEQALGEVQTYFEVSFPFLNKIGAMITKDLNFWIFKLKYGYRALKKSNVTVMELDQLETRIKILSKKYAGHIQNLFEISYSRIEDYSKQDIKQFLDSPLKSNNLRLFSRGSYDSQLSSVLMSF